MTRGNEIALTNHDRAAHNRGVTNHAPANRPFELGYFRVRHLWEVNVHISRDVEVVREHVERNMRDDLHNLHRQRNPRYGPRSVLHR